MDSNITLPKVMINSTDLNRGLDEYRTGYATWMICEFQPKIESIVNIVDETHASLNHAAVSLNKIDPKLIGFSRYKENAFLIVKAIKNLFFKVKLLLAKIFKRQNLETIKNTYQSCKDLINKNRIKLHELLETKHDYETKIADLCANIQLMDELGFDKPMQVLSKPEIQALAPASYIGRVKDLFKRN